MPAEPRQDSLDLLVVAGDASVRDPMLDELRRAEIPFRVRLISTLDEARAWQPQAKRALSLAEYRAGEWAGGEILEELRSRDSDLPIVLVTSELTEEMADTCVRVGADDFVLVRNLERLPKAVGRATAHRQASADLRRSREQFELLSIAVDQSPASVFITDTDGKIQYVNRRFTEITGYTSEEALGKNPRLLQSGRTPRESYERLWKTILAGGIWRSEILNRRKSGELYWSEVSISPMRDAEGAITHFVAVHEDTTERRLAEEAIREREARFRQIADSIKEVFFIVDADFRRVQYISPAYEDLFGRSRQSLYDDPTSYVAAIHPEDRALVESDIQMVQSGSEPSPRDIRIVHPEGEIRWLRVHATPVRNESGDVYRIAGIGLDITARVAAEDSFRRSEERLRKLIDGSFDIVVQSIGGVIREVSPGWTDVLGYTAEETVGRPILDFVAEESKEDVHQRVSNDVEGWYEVTLRHREGRRVHMEVTGLTLEVGGEKGRIAALRDVTRVRSLERELRQAQKLEAVARLAGGVAHDFNNVLTVVLTEIQLLKLDTERELAPETRAALDEVEAAARRAAALTRQLLTFARHDVIEPRVLDPIAVLDGLKKMLGRLIGEDVDLAVVHPETVGRVLIDRGHLEQVVVNLVVNARDAMPNGGDLRIEVSDVDLDANYAEGKADVRPGPHVLIAVSDSGIGMTPEVREQIFEPFFTTKPSGKGTGLGLATSYGIVHEARGHIGVYSELGVGTTMKVYLPRVSDAAALEQSEHQERAPAKLSATVLVVEDEEAVRRSGVKALEALGCRVLVASNGREALELVEKHRDAIDLMFTDVVMPGMTGPELVATARRIAPELKVLFTTGYTSDMAFRLELLEERVEVLAKPYSPADLGQKIRGVLGR
jgi:PAS domain S-box-containing protein